MATYRLFPTADGPSSPVSWGGSFLAGVLFQVTTGGVWFDGYWWWVCDTGQSAAAQKSALWVVYADGTGILIPAATVTSAALTAGQWNYIPLASPLPLSIGACYNAWTGFTGSFREGYSFILLPGCFPTVTLVTGLEKFYPHFHSPR